MATGVPTDPQTIAREFAELIRDEPDAAELWVSTQHDLIELLLVTKPTDAEAELRFAEAFGELIERHSQVCIRPRILNPRYFVDDDALRHAIPRGAARAPLQR